jgi:hypothetical protein
MVNIKKINFVSNKIPNRKIKSSSLKIKPINFLPTKKRQVPSSFNFIPKKTVKFISPEQYILPYPKKNGKKIVKKEMNWFQAKQRNYRLNPFGDADKDKVINMFDCRPYDSNKDGIISSAKSAASKVASAAKAAVGTTSKAAAKVYTSIDTSLKGALPGGAKATTTISKSIEKITEAPIKTVQSGAKKVTSAISSATKGAYTAIDTSLKGALPGGIKATTSGAKAVEAAITSTLGTVNTSVKQPTALPKTSPFISTTIGKTEGGNLPLSNTTTKIPQITTKITGKATVPKASIQNWYTQYDKEKWKGALPFGAPKEGEQKKSWFQGLKEGYTQYDKEKWEGALPWGAPKKEKEQTTTTQEDKKFIATKKEEEKKVELGTEVAPGVYECEGGYCNTRGDSVSWAPKEKEPDEPKGEEPSRTRSDDYTTTIAGPTESDEELTSSQIKTFLISNLNKYYTGRRWKPQNVTAMGSIRPSQLSMIGIQNASNVPLILNINPNENITIPDYILGLNPTIIYTTELPTRLAVYTPKTGTTGKTEYTEYSMRVTELPK